MKLITWNCQGAFRKKAEHILAFQPDILVVQECEHPSKLSKDTLLKNVESVYWHGDSQHKGICLFTFNNYKAKILEAFNPAFRYIFPFQVTKDDFECNLFAIWAMDDKENYYERYIGQVWLAVNYYQGLLGSRSILVGDFNSNVIWDTKDRIANHSTVVTDLEKHQIMSVYHTRNNIEQGEELDPTFFLQRNLKKPYHIDYCFASVDLLQSIEDFEVGKPDQWLQLSDHVPLIVKFGVR